MEKSVFLEPDVPGRPTINGMYILCVNRRLVEVFELFPPLSMLMTCALAATAIVNFFGSIQVQLNLSATHFWNSSTKILVSKLQTLSCFDFDRPFTCQSFRNANLWFKSMIASVIPVPPCHRILHCFSSYMECF